MIRMSFQLKISPNRSTMSSSSNHLLGSDLSNDPLIPHSAQQKLHPQHPCNHPRNPLPHLPLTIWWFVSTLTETNPAPFDLTEGESELISGFNEEYTAGPFACSSWLNMPASYSWTHWPPFYALTQVSSTHPKNFILLNTSIFLICLTSTSSGWRDLMV